MPAAKLYLCALAKFCIVSVSFLLTHSADLKLVVSKPAKSPLILMIAAIVVLGSLVAMASPAILGYMSQSALYSKFPVGTTYSLTNSNEDVIWFFDSPAHAAEYLRARQIGDSAATAELDKSSLFAISENGIVVRIIDDEFAKEVSGTMLKVRVEKAQEYSFLNGKSGWVLTAQFERKAKQL